MTVLDQQIPDARSYPKIHQDTYRGQLTTAAIKSTIQAAPNPAPALMNRLINSSYISEAERQLTCLSEAVGQDEVTLKKLLYAFRFSGGEWCQNPIPQKLDRSAWISDVSNDHSPFEYSLALSQQTGASELRFLIEAQPEENSVAALQKCTSRLTDDIAIEYGPTKVSLNKLNLVRDLFFPPGGEGLLASWHSFATSKKLEKWKIYLSPLASGRQNAFNVTREALGRLGLTSSWKLLETILDGDDYPVYFALGLSPNPEDAEVKIYVNHPNASAREIAQKHLKLDPSSSVHAIEQFYSVMANGSPGPYRGKACASCFHFKNKDPSRPAARTIFYPMDDQAVNDAEAKERIEKYMDIISAPQLYRERYRNAISAVQCRPLELGRGIHSWVSMKEKMDGTRSNTYYLSAELYGGLVDEDFQDRGPEV
jgi:tryptophanase